MAIQSEPKSEFIKTFKSMLHGHHAREIWGDWVFCSATAFSNAVEFDKALFNARESQYMSIVNKYKGSDYMNRFAKMLTCYIQHTMDFGVEDFLGDVYMSFEMGNDYNGQFFTPIELTKLMAQLTFDADLHRSAIEKNGYVGFSDPAVGAGSCLLALIPALEHHKISPRDIYMEGWDIDLTSALMAYIQLSVNNVPARIVCGNTLSQEIYSVWKTPSYVAFGTGFKLARAEKVKEEPIPTPSTPNLVGLDAIRAALYS